MDSKQQQIELLKKLIVMSMQLIPVLKNMQMPKKIIEVHLAKEQESLLFYKNELKKLQQ